MLEETVLGLSFRNAVGSLLLPCSMLRRCRLFKEREGQPLSCAECWPWIDGVNNMVLRDVLPVLYRVHEVYLLYLGNDVQPYIEVSLKATLRLRLAGSVRASACRS